MTNVDLKKFPWVFWLSIGFYKPQEWFTTFWSTRGSNFFEIRCYCIKIGIGRPWVIDVLKNDLEYPGNLKSALETNNCNLNGRFSIRMRNYKKFKDFI